MVHTPDHAWKIADIGEKRTKKRKEKGRKKRIRELGGQFADATIEPVKRFKEIHFPKSKENQRFPLLFS